jgi:HK97 family phage major capsid protein
MPKNLDELRIDLEQAVQQATNVQNVAAAEGRELTEDDKAVMAAAMDRQDALAADIALMERVQASVRSIEAGRGPRTAPNPPAAATVPAQARSSAPLFASFGEFARAVHHQAIGATVDPRLYALTPMGAAGDVIVSTDGFPIPPDMRTEIARSLVAEQTIAGRCRVLDTTSNEIIMPSWEAIPGTAGAPTVSWVGEGRAVVEQKVGLGQFRLPLHKMSVLIRVTEEALADAPLLESFLRTEIPVHMNYKLDSALVGGTGVGQPLGVLNAPALVTVAKESGQAADTLVRANIEKMFARLHPVAAANAFWLVSPDAYEQLREMAFIILNVAAPVGGHAAWLPEGAVAQAPYGTMLGRPIVYSPHASKLGDAGDVMLCNFGYYGLGRRTSGVNVATSMHFKFDQEEMAFRFSVRMGGQPLLSKPVPLEKNTSFTQSAFVALGERS